MNIRNGTIQVRRAGVIGLAGALMTICASAACAPVAAGQHVPAPSGPPGPLHSRSQHDLPPTRPARRDIAYAWHHPPEYPPEAVHGHHQGTVIVLARVADDGRVVRTRIGRSSGYPELDKSAAAAVDGWKFTPAYRDGKPQASWSRVPVTFYLPKAATSP